LWRAKELTAHISSEETGKIRDDVHLLSKSCKIKETTRWEDIDIIVWEISWSDKDKNVSIALSDDTREIMGWGKLFSCCDKWKSRICEQTNKAELIK